MRTFGNIIWHFPFFGFITALITFVIGLLLTATVMAAPVGLGLMELAKLLLAPFGKEMIRSEDLNPPQQNQAWKKYSRVIQVIYIPCVGIWLALLSIIQTILCFISIIGIPVGIVIAKSVWTYLNPVGKKCVTSAVAQELERQKAQREIGGHFAGPGNGQAAAPATGEHGGGVVAKVAGLPRVAIGAGLVVGLVVLGTISSLVGEKPTAVVVTPKGAEVQPVTRRATVTNDVAAAVERSQGMAAASAPSAASVAPVVTAPEAAGVKPAVASPLPAAVTRAAIVPAVQSSSGGSAVTHAVVAPAKAAAVPEKTVDIAKPQAVVSVVRPSPRSAPATTNAGSAAVAGILEEGAACMTAKRYDCAIANANAALRVVPADGRARALRDRAMAAQRDALDSISIN